MNLTFNEGANRDDVGLAGVFCDALGLVGSTGCCWAEALHADEPLLALHRLAHVDDGEARGVVGEDSVSVAFALLAILAYN